MGHVEAAREHAAEGTHLHIFLSLEYLQAEENGFSKGLKGRDSTMQITMGSNHCNELNLRPILMRPILGIYRSLGGNPNMDYTSSE